jgi:hypothetical protein
MERFYRQFVEASFLGRLARSRMIHTANLRLSVALAKVSRLEVEGASNEEIDAAKLEVEQASEELNDIMASVMEEG